MLCTFRDLGAGQRAVTGAGTLYPNLRRSFHFITFHCTAEERILLLQIVSSPAITLLSECEEKRSTEDEIMEHFEIS